MKKCVALILLFQFSSYAEFTKQQLEFFERKIRPVLIDKCYRCHSKDSGKNKGNFLLDSRAAILMGGDLGPAVVLNEPEQSHLYKAVLWNDEDTQMPPKEKLPDEVIADFRKWIKMGLPDPRQGEVQKKKEVDYVEGAKHWSYQKVKNSAIPGIANDKWSRNSIDKFVLNKMREKGLSPVSQADSVTLLRRLSLDLTGLLPSPELQESFLKESSVNFETAYVKLVDSLLEQPSFGEHWGRYWLDIVRYAETFGGIRQAVNPLMWKYRDYVIDSFNRDTPYGQFIREQIAGDLLPAKDLSQRRQQMIATGMLLAGDRGFSGGSGKKAEESTRLADDIDDMIYTVGHAFMGHSVACARCHDHKFDAISQKDYFALAGIFRSTQFYNSKVNPPIPKGPGGMMPISSVHLVAMADELGKLENAYSTHEKIAAMKVKIEATKSSYNRALKVKKGDPKKILDKIEKYKQSLAKLKKGYVPPSEDYEKVAAVIDLPKPQVQRLHVKGDAGNLGDVVPRGVLKVISNKVEMPENQSGRLQLAEWLSDESHPLTYRVFVNRVWQNLFGTGLVTTPDDFGVMGKEPSHPQLLDYLSYHFSKTQSVKKLIKFIVLSKTYRLSSEPLAAGMELDPDTKWRWRMLPRRLNYEVIRDSILQAGGQLKTGSPGPTEVAKKGFALASGKDLKYDDQNRAVYLSVLRKDIPGEFELFDFPDPSFVCGKRSVSSTAIQGLFMMNSDLVLNASKKVAERAVVEGQVRQSISGAIELILGRKAKKSELAYSVSRYESLVKAGMKPNKAFQNICQSFFASSEFRYNY